MVNEEYDQLEQELKSEGYDSVDDYLRKNKDDLSEHHLKLLEIVGFKF